jgi:TRAP-type C4-dicarboxylate transport system substrate-binding protein
MREDDRAVVSEVLRATYARLDAQNRLDNRQASEAMSRQGVRVVSPPAEELERWYAIGDQVTQALIARGTFSADLYRDIQGHLEAYRAL